MQKAGLKHVDMDTSKIKCYNKYFTDLLTTPVVAAINSFVFAT
jgi:hypothetical protein